jgi:signal transduction histidine kinase
LLAIAVYIAWQQWKVNERKLEFDQYERRLRIYERMVTFLRLVLRDFKPEINDLQAFSIDTAEADFLFGPEISQYLSELYHGAWRLRNATDEYRDFTQRASPDYDHNKVVKEITTQEEWFTNQFGVAKEKFKKYLDVSR